METNELQRKYKEAVLLFHQKKIIRFARRPIRFIAWKLLEWLASISGRRIEIKTRSFWGESMKIIFPEFISMNIFKYGFYEEGLTGIFLEKIKPNMVLLDVGAHFGYYSLLGSSLVKDQGQVHSFEPTMTSYNILRENTFGKNNIKINRLGVSNINKKIDFYDYGTKYSAFNSLYNPRMEEDLEPFKYNIDCVSIDFYVERENINPDFIKIDAESSEYDIIMGMQKTIQQIRPMITIEVGDMDIKGVQKDRDVIKAILTNGYRAYEYKNGKIIEHKARDNNYSYSNILFCPY